MTFLNTEVSISEAPQEWAEKNDTKMRWHNSLLLLRRRLSKPASSFNRKISKEFSLPLQTVSQWQEREKQPQRHRRSQTAGWATHHTETFPVWREPRGPSALVWSSLTVSSTRLEVPGVVASGGGMNLHFTVSYHNSSDFNASINLCRGVQPVARGLHAAQDGCECSPTQNRKCI